MVGDLVKTETVCIFRLLSVTARMDQSALQERYVKQSRRQTTIG